MMIIKNIFSNNYIMTKKSDDKKIIINNIIHNNDKKKSKSKKKSRKPRNKKYTNSVYNPVASSFASGGIVPIQLTANHMGSNSKFTLKLTGNQKKIMRESIVYSFTTAINLLTKEGQELFFKNYPCGIHIHTPEAATPKDGPSAGIGITTALVSVLTNIPVRADVAMTGEITLRGEVLPIGGLKEKLLAAHRGGIKIVLIPDQNVKDLAEIPENVKDCLDIRPVKWIEEVLESALERMPQAVEAEISVADVAKETKEVEVAAITKH